MNKLRTKSPPQYVQVSVERERHEIEKRTETGRQAEAGHKLTQPGVLLEECLALDHAYNNRQYNVQGYIVLDNNVPSYIILITMF